MTRVSDLSNMFSTGFGDNSIRARKSKVILFLVCILAIISLLGLNFMAPRANADCDCENEYNQQNCYYHSDSQYESALAYSAGQFNYPHSGFFAELYEIPNGNTLTCITYQFASKIDYDADRTFDAVVWSVDINGSPGDVLWEFNDIQIHNLTVYPTFTEVSVCVPTDSLITGTIYVGFRPHYSSNYLMYMIGADFNNWGKPMTYHPGYGKWLPVNDLYSSVHSLGIGVCYAEFTDPVPILPASFGKIKNYYK